MQGLPAVRHLASASKADASKTRAASLLDGAWEERPPPAPILQTRLGRMPSMARPSHLQIQSQAVLFKHLSDGRFSSTDRISSSSSRSGQESTSLSLATMVYRFMDEDSEVGKFGRSRRSGLEDAYDEIECSSADTDEHNFPVTKISADALQVLVSNMSTAEQKLLETIGSAVLRSSKETADLVCTDDEMNRSDSACKCYVIKKLHNSGYNAALCKSKWDSAGTQPGGEYEYIDIILRNSLGFDARLIVDLEFWGHFEIARPTREYRKLLKLLPSVFVGTTDKLQQIISTMCEAAKVSLTKRGLHLPPWRKSGYISAKWFSPHVRISSESALFQTMPTSNTRITSESSKFESMQPKLDLKATELEPYESFQKGNLPRLESRRVLKFSDIGLEESGESRNSSPEWKPPFVEPKNPQRCGRLVGLTAALRQSETAVIREQKMEQKLFVSALNPLRQRHEAESAAVVSSKPRSSNLPTLRRTSIYSKGFMKGF